MARNISAYLCDIIDACDSISSILAGISIDAYAETREKRSAVEREFILIGEAASMLAKIGPDKLGLLRKANPLQRNWSQRSIGVKLATKRAIHDCCNC